MNRGAHPPPRLLPLEGVAYLRTGSPSISGCSLLASVASATLPRRLQPPPPPLLLPSWMLAPPLVVVSPWVVVAMCATSLRG